MVGGGRLRLVSVVVTLGRGVLGRFQSVRIHIGGKRGDAGRYCPDYQMGPKRVRIFYMFNGSQLILQKRTVNGGQRRLV